MVWFNILKASRKPPQWRFAPIDKPAYMEAYDMIAQALESLKALPEGKQIDERQHSNPRVGKYIRYLERLLNKQDRNSLDKWWKHGRLRVEGADWTETLKPRRVGMRAHPSGTFDIAETQEGSSDYFYGNRPIKGLVALQKFVDNTKRGPQTSFDIDQANLIMEELIRDLETHFKKLQQSFEHQHVIPHRMKGIMDFRGAWDTWKNSGLIVNATEKETHWGYTYTWTPAWKVEFDEQHGLHGRFAWDQLRLRIDTSTQGREYGPRQQSGRVFGLCVEAILNGQSKGEWCVHETGHMDMPVSAGFKAMMFVDQSLTHDKFTVGYGGIQRTTRQSEEEIIRNVGWDRYLNQLADLRYSDVYPGEKDPRAMERDFSDYQGR